LKIFFAAMTLNPKAMKKAQEELDRVVDKGELPGFSHKDSLPYIDALIKEVLRWSPPLPLSPNRAMQDDIYRGYLIPAGTTVIGNVWAICRDPKIYPDPESFNPDRFLKDGKIDPLVFNPEDRVFGTGRR
jgi:cytochrome P450